MKFIFIFLFINIGVLSIKSQSMNGLKLAYLAEMLNKNVKGTEVDGLIVRQVTSGVNNLIWEYDVPIDWFPHPDGKQLMLQEISTRAIAKTAISNKINLVYKYYKAGDIIRTIKISPDDLIQRSYTLTDYLSLEGHKKSKGVNIKFKPPSNWKIQEGDRPNIVKKFTDGESVFLIQIREGTTFVSKSQAKELLSETSDNDFLEGLDQIMSNIEIIESKIVTIDNYSARFLRFAGEFERAGFKAKSHWNYWLFYYEDVFITFQGNYVSAQRDQRLETLFDQIINSVILLDQYD